MALGGVDGGGGQGDDGRGDVEEEGQSHERPCSRRGRPRAKRDNGDGEPHNPAPVMFPRSNWVKPNCLPTRQDAGPDGEADAAGDQRQELAQKRTIWLRVGV